MRSHTTAALGKTTASLGVLAVAGLWLASAADAHVTVSAPGATSGGGDQVITFRVPTESATASTVGLTVQLPSSKPIASVLVAPHTGWTDKVTSKKLATPIHTDDGDITDAVSLIVWTADTASDGIKPGQFDQFVIIAGQLPKTGSLTFRALQKYSDGSTVAWNQVAAPGSTDEPEHPAPVLTLSSAGSAASSQDPSSMAGMDMSGSHQSSTTSGNSGGASSAAATTGIVLGAVGVVLGATALALVVLRRRRDVTAH